MNNLCTKQPLNKGHPYITAKIPAVHPVRVYVYIALLSALCVQRVCFVLRLARLDFVLVLKYHAAPYYAFSCG